MNGFPPKGQPYAFGICRIEPENNAAMILEAFSEDPVMPLVMVGNWNAGKYGKELRTRYGNRPHLYLMDAVYDPEVLDPMRRKCALYVHGHSCGGTNPSLVEAMYCGLPVAAFDVDFNRETTENQALYFRNAEELKDICRTLTLPQAEKLRRKMKEIADRRYTWDRISRLYAELL